nr:uncharacterized protein CTRU02_03891 [Colletotrichum truncatum]KAF6796913.1 hypothetical protein CTRU02_03891 [Colletotrichum truncatum]
MRRYKPRNQMWHWCVAVDIRKVGLIQAEVPNTTSFRPERHGSELTGQFETSNKTIELLLTKQPHLTTLSTLEYHQNAHSDVMAGVKGYSVGDIQAQAAFTSEIEINGHPSLQDFVNFQDVHRKVMDARPGMYLKYLPHQFDVVNGQLRTGGAYLFDTHENAADYWDWTTNIFEVDEPKVKFWSQPLFKASKRFIWQVIGATNFGPVEYHAVGRFQRWTYDGANVEKELQRIYPELKRKAEEQGALAFWLLHHPEEKQIGIQLAFGKMEGTDPLTVGLLGVSDEEIGGVPNPF